MPDPRPGLGISVNNTETSDNHVKLYYSVTNNNPYLVPYMVVSLRVDGSYLTDFGFNIPAGETRNLSIESDLSLTQASDVSACAVVTQANDQNGQTYSGDQPAACVTASVPVAGSVDDPTDPNAGTWVVGSSNTLVFGTDTSVLGDGQTRSYEFFVGPDADGAGPNVSKGTRTWGGTIDAADTIDRRAGHTRVTGTVVGEETSAVNADIYEVTGNVFAFTVDTGLNVWLNNSPAPIPPEQIATLSGELTDPSTCEGMEHQNVAGSWEIQEGACTWVADPDPPDDGNGDDGTNGGNGDDGTGGDGPTDTSPDRTTVVAGLSLLSLLAGGDE